MAQAAQPSGPAMTPVTSGAIAELGYDPIQKICRVKFKSGRVYQYSGIEPGEFNALKRAKSIGRHFNTRFPRETATEVTE